jgi:DNA sulfur modification protein DndD
VIIERVTLTNFGSYRGSTQIDLSPDGEKNITLIVGHGGAGKTNIGKAIRWALYNLKFEGRAGDKEYLKEDVLGLFFREGGGALANKPPTETSLSVKLEIWPGEAVRPALVAHDLKFGKYVLERRASVGKIVPSARDVILPPLSLKGPNQRELPDAEGFIEEFLLPASTSTFFMFHGDRVRDLTAQIDQPVTDSIKQILDVTAMNNAVSDLKVVLAQLARKVAATSDDEEQRVRKQAAWDNQDVEERRQLDIKKEKEDLLKQARLAAESLESEQGDLLEAAGLFAQYDSKEKRKNELEEECDAVDQQLRTLIDQVPKEILYHTLYKRAVDLRGQDADNQAHEKNIESLDAKKNQLRQLLAQRRCPVCKQAYADSMLSSYKKEIERIESDIKKEAAGIEPLDPALAEIMQIVLRFESSKYDPAALRKKRHEYRVKITDLETEIETLKAKLKKFHSADIRKQAAHVEVDLKQKNIEIGALQNSIKELDRVVSEIQKHKLALQKDLYQLGGVGSTLLRKQHKLADALHETFSDAVIELADDKRQEIARETGDMLMKVTIKPELFHKTNPIDVDDDFQVRAMNYEGNPLVWTAESSSEREVLAVSFIYGLLKASEREAPVILDTFFGNLDPNQIRNLTGHLSSFGSQVVLMTTVTEFLDLVREAPASFWQHVCRYIFLRNSDRTDFVTKLKVITDQVEAQREAEEEKKEFAIKEVKI